MCTTNGVKHEFSPSFDAELPAEFHGKTAEIPGKTAEIPGKRRKFPETLATCCSASTMKDCFAAKVPLVILVLQYVDKITQQIDSRFKIRRKLASAEPMCCQTHAPQARPRPLNCIHEISQLS